MKLECLKSFSMRVGKRFYVKQKGDIFEMEALEAKELILSKLAKEYIEPVLVQVVVKQRKKKVVDNDALSNE